MKVTVIIPFLNEEENIPSLTEALNSFFKTEKDFKAEVIFVDDGSTDNSVKLLKQEKHEFYQGRIISLSKNFGSHAALRAGILNSTGDYVTFMYADLQDPLSILKDMFVAFQSDEKKEIIWASRRSTESGLAETIFSKTYAALMKKYVSKQYPQKGFDIVMFSRKVVEILNKNVEANSSIFLQILTLGFKHDFIFYDKQPRKKGVSKWTFSKKVKLFIDSFVAFSYAPIRFVTTIGIILFIIGVAFSAYLIVRKMIYNDLVSGWPMLISILSIGFGITNISLGIIAEYLWRTLDAARNRPVFIIDNIIEL